MKFSSSSAVGSASVVCELRAHVDLLGTVEIDGLDESGVMDLVRSNERAVRVLNGVAVRAAVRLDELGGLSAEDVFSTVGKQSQAAARRLQRRAKLAETMPRVAESLIAGTVGVENADIVAGARHKLRHNPTWQDLFDSRDGMYSSKAGRLSPRRFAEWMGREVARISDDGATDVRSERDKNSFRCWKRDGRWHARLDLDALAGEKLQAAIDSEARSLTKQCSDAGENVHHGDLLKAYSLESLIDAGNGAMGRASINVIVDLETLTNGVWEGTTKRSGLGKDIPLPYLRRLLCDSWITPVCIDQAGRALAVGRTRRTATDAQRAALGVMYPTCAVCDTEFGRCEIHHIQFWENGGVTDLHNLIPLCGVHHHRVHDDGWSIELDQHRNLLWKRPDGTVFQHIKLPSEPTARHRRRARERERKHGTTE
jgi:hypothetical protein